MSCVSKMAEDSKPGSVFQKTGGRHRNGGFEPSCGSSAVTSCCGSMSGPRAGARGWRPQMATLVLEAGMREKRGHGPHPPGLQDGDKTGDVSNAWKSHKTTPKTRRFHVYHRISARLRETRFTGLQAPNFHGASRKRVPSQAGRPLRGVFHQVSLSQLLCALQLCSGLRSRPRPPRGSGLLMGAALAAAASKFSGIPGRALGDYTAVIWD